MNNNSFLGPLVNVTFEKRIPGSGFLGTFLTADKIFNVTIPMKATMQYFPVVLFMLYKVALWKKFLTASIYVKATV